MASRQLMYYDSILYPAIKLDAMANAAGAVSVPIDNTTTRAPAAHIFVKIGTATAPTANTPYKVYVVRHSNDLTNPLIEGFVSGSSGSLSSEPVSAQLIGSIIVSNTTSGSYISDFIAYDLPPKYSIAVWNGSGQTSNVNPVSSSLQVIPFMLEAQ